jgi:hypothetical protein
MRLLLPIAAAALVFAGCGEAAQTSTTTSPATATASARASPSASASPHITAAQKAQVQAILQAAIDHYATEFAAGQTALSHKGTNDFYNWRHSTNIEQDVQTFLDAFTKADANYTADSEPAAMASWRDDMSTVQADIVVWVHVAVSWQIGQKTDTDLAAATATVNKDFDTVRADLAHILSAS